MQKLVSNLNNVGKSTELFHSPDGSRVLLLPYGARILGLFSPDSDNNLIWHNSELESPDSARAIFDSDGWQNTGGDRTWLTPEVDIFFPDYPDTNRHWEPPQLDASDYAVTKSDHDVTMAKTLSVDMARAKIAAEVEVSKTISAAANPLRHEPGFSGVSYAGYTLHTGLKLLGYEAQSSVKVGLWNLLQMPVGGDMLIPTYSKATPKVLFGDIAPSNLISDDHLVRFRIVAKGEHKIALRAVATTGRAGYMLKAGDNSSLVIRNFAVNPSGDYVDVPKNELDDYGYSFHAVSVDSALGQFCELEYHVPAVGQGTGRVQCEDECQVWAFSGSEAEITGVARLLLSPSA